MGDRSAAAGTTFIEAEGVEALLLLSHLLDLVSKDGAPQHDQRKPSRGLRESETFSKRSSQRPALWRPQELRDETGHIWMVPWPNQNE